MMQQFKSSAELKANAREHLLGHYGTAIGAYLLLGVMIGAVSLIVSLIVDTNTISGTLLYYAIMFLISLLTGLFSSGSAYLYLKIVCGRPVSVGDLFYGFQLYPDKAIAIQAWITLITYATNLPQIILELKIMPHINHPDKVMHLLLPYSLALIFQGWFRSYSVCIMRRPFTCSTIFRSTPPESFCKKAGVSWYTTKAACFISM